MDRRSRQNHRSRQTRAPSVRFYPLETARAFDLSVVTRKQTTRITFDPYDAPDMQRLIDAWLPITFTVNSLNRSMGQSDLYPFILAAGSIAKLAFIHALIHRQQRRD